MSDGGKGSRPRPFSVSSEEFDNNWNKIFKSKNEKRQETQASETCQSSQPGNMAMPGLQQDNNG